MTELLSALTTTVVTNGLESLYAFRFLFSGLRFIGMKEGIIVTGVKNLES